MDEREALRQAVITLVEAPDAEYLYDALTAAVKLARVHAINLAGDAATLNPLLHLGVADVEAFDRVLALIDRKRADAGRPALQKGGDDKFDKVEYQRVFMEQKRLRQRRAADVENLQRPDRERLVGRARLDFMDRCAAEWKRELDALLARARENLGVQRLPREHLDALRTQFWASVDARLDSAEQDAREKKARRT